MYLVGRVGTLLLIYSYTIGSKAYFLIHYVYYMSVMLNVVRLV